MPTLIDGQSVVDGALSSAAALLGQFSEVISLFVGVMLFGAIIYLLKQG